MAFSAEILDFRFEGLKQNYSYSRNEEFQQNTAMAYEYLIGKYAAIPVFHSSYENSYFVHILAPLFFEAEDWTKNDELLLSFFLEPTIHGHSHGMGHILASFLNGNHSKKMFDKVLTIFKKMGYSDDDLFKALLYNLQLAYMSKDAPVILFLKEIIKHSSLKFISSLTNPSSHYSSDWNHNIFILLDWADSSKAEEYLVKQLSSADQWRLKSIVESLIKIDYDKFYPFIQQKVDKMDSEVELKFELQTVCYRFKTNPDPLEIYSLSEDFLEKYCTVPETPDYEQSISTLLENKKSVSYHLSTYAVYSVTILNAERGLFWINKIVETKNALHKDLLELIEQNFPEIALPYFLRALQLDTREYSKRIYYQDILERITKYPLESYVEQFWKLEQFKPKLVKELIAIHLIKYDKEAEVKAVPLLENKKGDIRLLAVLIISSLGSKEGMAILRTLLNKEKNDDTRDAMLYALGDSSSEHFTENDITQLVEATSKRGKLAKPVAEWLEEAELPALYLRSGKKLNGQEIRFVIYRMSRVKEMRSDIEAKPILALVDREKSIEFSKKIFKLYADKGYDVKFKYLMALSVLTGNEEIVDKLRSAINEWIDSGRKVMSEYGIGALAIQGSNRALRWVEWYSRKYRSKKSYVGETAIQALQNAADELGITMNELGDRIVPDFGFEGLFKSFEAGGEEFRAFIDGKFKLAFFNEDNKKIKSVPAAAEAELKEEFKNITKEVKDVVKSQSLRLEHYLITQRVWKMADWNKFFLENPVMFIYATKLLWVQTQNGVVKEYFICQEDTSLTNIEDDEISLEETDTISMAHPYYMQEELSKNWKQKFFDLSIDSIFPQLERPVTKVEDEEKGIKSIKKFDGRETENGVLRAALERQGWGKGATGDGGYVDYFVKDDFDLSIQAIIEVQGVFVGGYGYDHEPKLGRLYFLDKAKKGTSRWFNYPQNDEDERLIALKDVPPVFYSEVIADLNAIKIKVKPE